MSSKNLKSPKDIFQMEQDVMAKLNTFNQTYATYLRCTTNPSNSKNQYIDKSTCPANGITDAEVTTAYNNVQTSIATLKGAMALMDNTGVTPKQYDMNYNNMLSSYKTLTDTRKQVDQNLAELYNTTDGTASFYNKMYMGTIYSKILLTVLATSIVYFGIMKLRK
jgi:hypothetical protein